MLARPAGQGRPTCYPARMAEKFLDKVYETAPDALTDLYDDWAANYDAELGDHGYATPARLATLLARHAPDTTAPLLDFGCGTGLGGAALAKAGFTTLDGCDLSQPMLAEARAKGHYRTLWQTDPDTPLPFDLAAYPLVTAVGVISTGAAPADTLGFVARAMSPGAILALSYNDHTLEDPAYTEALDGLLGATLCQLDARHGPHIPDLGLGSTVYILKRL